MGAQAGRWAAEVRAEQAPPGKVRTEPLRSRAQPRGGGFGLWLTLYVTGAALAVLVLAHLVAAHYLAPDEGIRTMAVRERLQGSLWWWVVDLGLLVAALVHGLAGIYRILDEGRYLQGARRWVAVAILAAAGLVGLQAGIQIFRAFLGAGGPA